MRAGENHPRRETRFWAGLCFLELRLLRDSNKGVLVVYLCAYKGTGNKCTYYLVKSCNVAINACKLVFLTGMLFWFSLNKKKDEKKEKESKQG